MPRIHTIDMQRLTPLGQLIAEYMRHQWPRLQTKAELAHFVGVRPSTIDNLMYSQHEPSTRTLNKIAHATGISAAALSEAAYAGHQAAQPPAPPRRREEDEPRSIPRIAEQAPRYAALDEWVRHTRMLGLSPEVEQALISTTVESVTGYTLEQLHWQERYREEHDIAAISTMEYPAITAGQQQPEHRPAAETNTQRTSERLVHK